MGTGMRTGSTGPGGRQLLIDLKTRKPPAVPSYVEAYNTIVCNLSLNACINLHASQRADSLSDDIDFVEQGEGQTWMAGTRKNLFGTRESLFLQC